MIHISERTTEPLLVSDRPWEEFCLGYVTVLREGNTWQMWYSAYDAQYQYDCDSYLCYARSVDGVRWEKPSLGLIEYAGSRENNIVHDGPADRANVTTIFRDPHAPPAERYKGLAQRFLGRDTSGKGVWKHYGAVSPDGLRWTLHAESHYPWNADTQNVCFWDGDRYRMYVRLWHVRDEHGNLVTSTETAGGVKRTIGLTESTDFTRFPMAREILAPAEDDPPDMDFYGNACTKLRDDLYLIFTNSYYHDEDVVRSHAAVSRDGRQFQRLGRDPILDLGSGFDSQTLYVAPGPVPGDRPNTWWFYYLGTGTKHNQNYPTKTRRSGGMGRFLVELDGSDLPR